MTTDVQHNQYPLLANLKLYVNIAMKRDSSNTDSPGKIFVILSSNFWFFQKDFLWTMDRDRNGHDGRNGHEWTAEWTIDDRRWTMDNGQRLCRALQADSNIADLTDPTDPSDPSEKPIGQITNSRAIPSLKATTLQTFRVFRAFRGQKKSDC